MHKTSPVKENSLLERRISGVSILLTFQGGCHLIFTILGAMIFLFTIASWTDLGTKDFFIEDYINNWKLKPLIDITTETSRGPEGYENLITREFATDAGGDCLGVEDQGNRIYKGSCDVTRASARCQSIIPMDKTILSKFFSHNICGMRSGQSFTDIERPNVVNDQLVCSENK